MMRKAEKNKVSFGLMFLGLMIKIFIHVRCLLCNCQLAEKKTIICINDLRTTTCNLGLIMSSTPKGQEVSSVPVHENFQV